MGNRIERFNSFRLELSAAKTGAEKAKLIREFTLQERLLAILNSIARCANRDVAEIMFNRIFQDPYNKDLTDYMLRTPAKKLAAYLEADYV